MLQKLKELAVRAEDVKEIVFDLIPQSDSDNSDDSMDHINKNSTFITVSIYQTRYTSPTIAHSLEPPPPPLSEKRMGTIQLF